MLVHRQKETKKSKKKSTPLGVITGATVPRSSPRHRHDLHDTNAGAVHLSSISRARQTIRGCLLVCKLVRACMYCVVLCCD